MEFQKMVNVMHWLQLQVVLCLLIMANETGEELLLVLDTELPGAI